MPTTTADTPEQGTSLEEAAKAMEGLLDPHEDTEDTSTSAADATPAETDESVAKAKADSEETPAAEEEAEVEEAKATDADEDAEVAEAQPATITVKIDGKTQAIPVEEAAKGYQRQADYSRKMDALVADRQKLESDAKAIQEERQTYATMLVALRKQLQNGGEEEPDWEQVYQEDPAGYARRRDIWRDRQEKIAAANFELQRVEAQQRKEHEENLQKLVTKGRADMFQKMPAWKDQKVWDTDRQAIVRYAQQVAGYTAEEISQAYDPRAIVLLHKARLYDELMANKPKPAAPKGPKVAAAGAAPAQGNASRLNAAQQRLAKSGRLEDAAKLFEQII